METPGGAERLTVEQALRHALADLERACVALSDARTSLGENWDPPGPAPGPALTQTSQDKARRFASVTIRTSPSEIDTAAEALRRAAGGAR
jgi:hypothetical protein